MRNKYLTHVIDCLKRAEYKRRNPLAGEILEEITQKTGIDLLKGVHIVVDPAAKKDELVIWGGAYGRRGEIPNMVKLKVY